jgi:hypothetical protein
LLEKYLFSPLLNLIHPSEHRLFPLLAQPAIDLTFALYIFDRGSFSIIRHLNPMPHPKYYSPPIKRFLVAVLYHEARKRKQPMTVLTNSLLESALRGSDSWHQAQSAMMLKEDPPLHHLVKLKKPKLVVTPLAPMTYTQQVRLFRSIESYLDGLSRRDFVPSPGLHCSSCEYFNECRRWTGKEGKP